MTISDIIKIGSQKLKCSGCEDAEFDSSILAQFALNYNSSALRIHYSENVDNIKADLFFKFIERRMSGEPLQYIVGEWEFMGFPFNVGEGVLIPRPETELLVEFAVDFLKDKENPIVFDLCSGSGCIGISVARLCSNATVYLVEKSNVAYKYLISNIELNGVKNIKPINGDIFDKSLLTHIKPDLILSNPPYIRTDEIKDLQQEVRMEPVMALDGGKDGYEFYRVIAENWLDRISENGAVAVECGEDQTDEIIRLFSSKTSCLEKYTDYSNLLRGVIAYK